MSKAMELLKEVIADLESRLNLQPGEPLSSSDKTKNNNNNNNNNNHSTLKKKTKPDKQQQPSAAPTNNDLQQLPDICKLEFKVGIITKVWYHEKADKLFCEEIDVGEGDDGSGTGGGPRLIASGLRPYYTLEQMLHHRVIVITNLKPKNLLGFKSHGMVLCAVQKVTTISNDGNNEEKEKEMVEFVEPPIDAKIGEIITFTGLPQPVPVTPNQCEKLKLFTSVVPFLSTNENGMAQYKNENTFMTSAGPCTAKTIMNGSLR